MSRVETVGDWLCLSDWTAVRSECCLIGLFGHWTVVWLATCLHRQSVHQGVVLGCCVCSSWRLIGSLVCLPGRQHRRWTAKLCTTRSAGRRRRGRWGRGRRRETTAVCLDLPASPTTTTTGRLPPSGTVRELHRLQKKKTFNTNKAWIIWLTYPSFVSTGVCVKGDSQTNLM